MTDDLATVTAPESEDSETRRAADTEDANDPDTGIPAKDKSPSHTTRESGQRSLTELKRIMNDVVQIKELRQHLQTLGHEIIDDLTAMLQLASAQGLRLKAWGRAVTLYPNGFLLTEEPDGTVRSQHLNDLDPAQLHQLMQQLIPSARASLRDAKQSQESLAGDLEAIHDTLSESR